MCVEGIKNWSNDYFKGIRRHWMLKYYFSFFI